MNNRTLKPIDHGTQAGYRAHLRRKIPTCEACRKAGAVARKNSKDRRRQHLIHNPPTGIDGNSPSAYVLCLAARIDDWAEDSTISPNPAIRDAAVAVAANINRLRVSVHNLESALLRHTRPPSTRQAS